MLAETEMEEPIEVNYRWTADERATAYELLPVFIEACVGRPPPTPRWFILLVELLSVPLFIGAMALAVNLYGGWGMMGVLFAPTLGVVLIWGYCKVQSRRARRTGLPEGKLAEFRFRVNERAIEWWVADQLSHESRWEEVVRCHRGEKGFLICFANAPPMWLPNHGFSDPAAIDKFIHIARRGARSYTGDRPEEAEANKDRQPSPG
jgi:hypothetical protein